MFRQAWRSGSQDEHSSPARGPHAVTKLLVWEIDKHSCRIAIRALMLLNA